jgi:hypothetical protein
MQASRPTCRRHRQIRTCWRIFFLRVDYHVTAWHTCAHRIFVSDEGLTMLPLVQREAIAPVPLASQPQAITVIQNEVHAA